MRPITLISLLLALRTNARPLNFDLPITEIFKDPNPPAKDNPYGPLEVHSDRGNGIHRPGDNLHLDDTWPDFVSGRAVRRADPAGNIPAVARRDDEQGDNAVFGGVEGVVDAALEIATDVLGLVAVAKRSVAEHPVQKREFIQFLASIFDFTPRSLKQEDNEQPSQSIEKRHLVDAFLALLDFSPGPDIQGDDGLPQQSLEKRNFVNMFMSLFDLDPDPKPREDGSPYQSFDKRSLSDSTTPFMNLKNRNLTVEPVTPAPEKRDIDPPAQKRSLIGDLLAVIFHLPQPGEVIEDAGPGTLETKKKRFKADEVAAFFSLVDKFANATATTTNATATAAAPTATPTTNDSLMPILPRSQDAGPSTFESKKKSFTVDEVAAFFSLVHKLANATAATSTTATPAANGSPSWISHTPILPRSRLGEVVEDAGQSTLETAEKKKRFTVEDVAAFFNLPKSGDATPTPTTTITIITATPTAIASTNGSPMPILPRSRWSYAKEQWENRQLRAMDPITNEPIAPSQDRQLLPPIDPATAYGEVEVELPANPTQADLLCQKLEGFEKLIMLLAYFGCPKKM